MSTTQPEPGDRDLEQRLDEEREAGTVHRPLQQPATEGIAESLAEERRAVGEAAKDDD